MLTKFPTRYKQIKYEIEQLMLDYGLDPFLENPDGSKSMVVFEILDWDDINEIAAYGGFPRMYPNWRWGQEYEYLNKTYTYGLQKIYELVINNRPTCAYLMDSNNEVDQKIVMAHVYAHADFFKNNDWFAGTDRDAVNAMANRAVMVERYERKYGTKTVQDWIDVCMSVSNLIDHQYYFHKQKERARSLLRSEEEPDEWSGKFPAKSYMDSFINPEKEVEEYRAWLKKKQEREKDIKEKKLIFPGEPQKDVMLFLAMEAPLEQWQRDILLMLREIAYYFLPQAQTKILNEGWATYWHEKACIEGGLLTPNEIVDFADHHSGALLQQSGHINPYKLGFALLKHIKRTYDDHRRGEIYRDCDERFILENWEPFVVYFNALKEHNGDRKNAMRTLNEFLGFWNACRQGLCGYPAGIFDRRWLLCDWNDYTDVNDISKQHCLKENEDRVSGYMQKIRQYRKEKGKAEKLGDMKAVSHYRDAIELAKKFIKRYQGWRNVYRAFQEMHQAFERGELELEPFQAPEKFFEYADKFVDKYQKLEIGTGNKEIFRVRKSHNDLTALEAYFDEELCEELKFFQARRTSGGYYEIFSRDFQSIKKSLLLQYTHLGEPDIRVTNAKYNGNGLYLLHYHDGRDLSTAKLDMNDTIYNLYLIWQNPVYVETILNNEKVRFSSKRIKPEKIKNKNR